MGLSNDCAAALAERQGARMMVFSRDPGSTMNAHPAWVALQAAPRIEIGYSATAGLVWSKRSHAQPQNIKPCAFKPPAWLFSQDLLHRFPVGEFVDQFVQVADFLHRRFLDVFHANATDRTGN